MKILVLNSGSSSQKSALFELDSVASPGPVEPLWQAKIEWGGPESELSVRGSNGVLLREKVDLKDRQAAIRHMLDTLWNGKTRVIADKTEIAAVGHRVVHGGPSLTQPTRITSEVKAAIAAVGEFAPLHSRAELEGMAIVETVLGDVSQVAVFDTGFHRTIIRPAAQYPGPYEWFEQGIRRYGFHGINHEYCAHRAAQLLHASPDSLRIVSCHLGNGCSLAAIRDGKSIDTTMGFTPLEGLMMGTRSGSIDPGILTYFMRKRSITGDKLDELLNRRSGLLGISGVSSDMREVEAAMKKGNKRAQLAFDMFAHRLSEGISAMIAALGGLDVLVFTAGIGENSPQVRAAACEKLGFAGIKIDLESNQRSPSDREISAPDSNVRVWIVPAQEDWAIAQECFRLATAA